MVVQNHTIARVSEKRRPSFFYSFSDLLMSLLGRNQRGRSPPVSNLGTPRCHSAFPKRPALGEKDLQNLLSENDP